MSAEYPQFVPVMAGKKHCCGTEDGCLGLQLLGETTQRNRGGRDVLDRRHPIDDEERGSSVAYHPTDGGNNAVKSLLYQGVKEIEVVHPVTDERWVKEAKPAQICEHQVVRLRHERRHDDAAPRGRVVKSELTAERGLAGTRWSSHEAGTTNRQPATENRIEARDPGLQPW